MVSIGRARNRNVRKFQPTRQSDAHCDQASEGLQSVFLTIVICSATDARKFKNWSDGGFMGG